MTTAFVQTVALNVDRDKSVLVVKFNGVASVSRRLKPGISGGPRNKYVSDDTGIFVGLFSLPRTTPLNDIIISVLA